MKRINTPTASSGKFVDGNPSIGRKATQFSAEWCNNVQMELWNAIKKLSGSDPAGAQTMDDFATALDAWLGNVLVDSSDRTPGKLAGKFYDVGSPIGVSVVNVGAGRYIVIGIKDGSIDTHHIKDAAVEEAKIEDGAVTENKLGAQSVSTDKIKFAAVKAVKLDTTIFENENDDFFTNSGPFETLVRTYTAVNARGFLDVTVDLLCKWGSTPSTGYSQVALEIRDHDSGTVLKTYSIGVPEYGAHYVKRFIVRNAETEAKNYDLYVSGTFTDTTPHGVTPTIGDFVSTGIVFN